MLLFPCVLRIASTPFVVTLQTTIWHTHIHTHTAKLVGLLQSELKMFTVIEILTPTNTENKTLIHLNYTMTFKKTFFDIFFQYTIL